MFAIIYCWVTGQSPTLLSHALSDSETRHAGSFVMICDLRHPKDQLTRSGHTAASQINNLYSVFPVDLDDLTIRLSPHDLPLSVSYHVIRESIRIFFQSRWSKMIFNSHARSDMTPIFKCRYSHQWMLLNDWLHISYDLVMRSDKDWGLCAPLEMWSFRF